MTAEVHELVDQIHRGRGRDQKSPDSRRDQPAGHDCRRNRHEGEHHERVRREEGDAPVVMIGKAHLAVPDRAGGTFATATAFIGPTLRPSPQPMASNPVSISTWLSLSGIKASMSRPSPISAMPAVMGTRGPSLLAMGPESCDVMMKLRDIGSSATAASSAEAPRTVWK